MENANTDCIICLEKSEKTMNNIVDRCNVIVNCNCNCSIHKKCLIEWLDRKMCCPICKKTIEKKRDKYMIVKKNYLYVIKSYIVGVVLLISIVLSILMIFIFICIMMKIILNHY